MNATEQKLNQYREQYKHLMNQWLKSYGAEFIDAPKAYMTQHVIDAMMSTTQKQKQHLILSHEAIEYEPEVIEAQFAIATLKNESERLNQEHMLQSFDDSL